jgi:hypothetical protein
MNKSIMAAIENSWNEGGEPHIMFAVTNEDGSYDSNIKFPKGRDLEVGDNLRAVVINLGLNACRSFNFDQESGDFVYDVGVNGTTFFGNIPLSSVMMVFNKHDNAVIFSADDATLDKPEVVKPVSKPTKQIGLSLASYTENPKPSSTYKKWTPKLV